MRRVSVVGTSGSGKSTLARTLAATLDLECLELDSVFHQPGWVPLPREEFRRRVAAPVARERWVIDGNYTNHVKDLAWARAETVVWLDFPLSTVMRRIIWRSFWRVAARTELWNGNRERWRSFFSLAKAMADPENRHLRFIRLATPAAARRFLSDADQI
jgi:adenylate kinase family enzyme